jgi:hypothetical protein
MSVSPKQALFEHFARIGKAVGSPARLELLVDDGGLAASGWEFASRSAQARGPVP